MFNFLKHILLSIQAFINKSVTTLIELINEAENIINSAFSFDIDDNGHPYETSTKEDEPLSSIDGTVVHSQIDNFNSFFFDSEGDEVEYLKDLSALIKKTKIKPELALYLFAYSKKIPGSKLDNEMTALMQINNNAENFMSLITKHSKLNMRLFSNGKSDIGNTIVFSDYLFKTMFEPTSTIINAKYNNYFYKLLKG